MDLHRHLRSLALLIFILATYFSSTLSRHHPVRHRHNRHKRQHHHHSNATYVTGSFVIIGHSGPDVGNWGPWSEPSDCSRSCGGGVAYQTRRCRDIRSDGIEECLGGNKRYFSCNIQDCPDSEADYRAEQCAEFNKVPFKGLNYKWIPYLRSRNKCELSCAPKGERFYYRHKSRVADGTRCDEEKLDVCVEGQCLTVGCDMILGSPAREDKCRECEGDGSSCTTVKNVLETDDLQVGYNDVLLIPAGATNIRIDEVRASNNYLAIRNMSNHYFLNGDWKINLTRTYKFAGAIFHYEQKPHSFLAPELITALGPTTEPIYLVILYQEKNPGVSYEFSIPKGLVQQTEPDSYSWIHEDFSECSVTCGGGQQSRKVMCVRRKDLVEVGSDLCNPILEPKQNQSCNTDPCPAQWLLGEWGQCSKTCGEGGTQIRQVYCERVVSSGLPSVVGDEQCSDTLGPKPTTTQTCNEDIPCPSWHLGPWKPCDRLCGDGKRRRRVRCFRWNEGKIEVLGDSSCSGDKPQDEIPCMLRPCEGVDWVLSEWSGCEDKCGLSQETRKAHCANQAGKVYPDSQCKHHRLPMLIQECENYKGCDYEWFASQWSECSADCGTGIKTRRVFCGDFDGETVRKVEYGKCDPSKKYEAIGNCTGKEECHGQWFSGPWTPCSKKCGGGDMSRKVLCYIENRTVEANKCDPSVFPFLSTSCNNHPCTEDQIMTVEPAHQVSEEEEECEEEDSTFITLEPTLGVDLSQGVTPDSSGEVGSGDQETTPSGMVTESSRSSHVVFSSSSYTSDSPESMSSISSVEFDLTSKSSLLEVTSESSFSSMNLEDLMLSDSTGQFMDAESTLITAPTSSEDSFTTDDYSFTSDEDYSFTEYTTTEEDTSAESISVSESITEATTTPISVTESESTSEIASTTASDLVSSTEAIIESTTTDDETSSASSESTVDIDSTSATSSVDATTETASVDATGVTSSDDSSSVDGTTTPQPTVDSFTSSSSSEETSASEISSETSASSETDVTETTVTETSHSTDSTTTEEAVSSTSEETLSSMDITTETSKTDAEMTTTAMPEVSISTTISAIIDDEDIEEPLIEPMEKVPVPHATSSSAPTESTTEDVTSESSVTSTSTESMSTGTSVTSTESAYESTEQTESTTELTESTSELTSVSTSDVTTASSDVTTASSELTTETTDMTTESTVLTAETSELTAESTLSTTESTVMTTEQSTEMSPEETTSEAATESSLPTSSESTSVETSVSPTERTSSQTTELPSETESPDTSRMELGSTSSVYDIFTTTPTPAQVAVTKEQKIRKCKRKKKPSKPKLMCGDTKFGCCPDGVTEAQGPFSKGCQTPETCAETKFGCCSDGVSPATGPNEEGCPPSLCANSLFGCCPDEVTIAEGNDYEGCKDEMVPFDCNETQFGCCPDNTTKASGPNFEGCFECEGSGDCDSCNDTKYGCCPDGIRAASGDNYTGCEDIEGSGFIVGSTTTEESEDCTVSEFGCCPNGFSIAEGPYFEGCGVINRDNCTLSYFGCCADGVSPALGPDFLGCRMPCDDSAHGCCDDRITAAHGPNREGCCLNTQYGCCPDNILVAQGPNLEGCGCQYSPYGCCPDDSTTARGHNAEGCGCQFTTHGCCPNKYTPAAGPNFQGCPCYTHQFGCCPDGVTIAKGPQSQGCGCENTQFGCCSDNRTPALGLEKEGCGCESSKYGCCPDGMDEAAGEKFEGCTNIPLSPRDDCIKPKDRGVCRDFTVKWFFDTVYGGCTRFWYGGCGGNKNRFGTQVECNETCVAPSGRDACYLAKIEGPCEGYYPTWYYDSERKQCGQFIYGGCLGNNNKFQTREECEELCVLPDTIDACEQDKLEGPCLGNYTRWYYDKEERTCQRFKYGGCKGNANNFATETACHQQCLQPGKSRVMDICALPKDMGPCPGSILRWHYDATDHSCKQFIYGGCQGNSNRFKTEEECKNKCHVSDVAREQDICSHPAIVGECYNYTERWYYNAYEVRCVMFYYGGCGGNQNNFHTMQQCQQRCESRYDEPVPEEEFNRGSCLLPIEHGPCSDSIAKWHYDSRDGVCKQFLYGGCQGNANRFSSQQDCEKKCEDVQDICTLPRVVGPCNAIYRQWYYDSISGECLDFNYGGCQGNGNRFSDRRQCEERCRKSFTTAAPEIDSLLLTTKDPSINEVVPDDICNSPVDAGPCRGGQAAWYYNGKSGDCEAFTYGGCEGNANRFQSEEQCERQCGAFKGQDVCNIPYDHGRCRGSFQKWFFDNSRGKCREFIYGGCNGNGNRFSSIEECESICVRREEILPTGNDTTLSNQVPQERPEEQCTLQRERCNQLHCPYGVERSVDERNCEVCGCFDPCRGSTCPSGSNCAVDLQRNQVTGDTEFKAICRTANKPGECPSQVNITGKCSEECQSDADCSGDFKCCFTGCGSSCVQPARHEDHLTTEGPFPHRPELGRGEKPPRFDSTEAEVVAEQGSYATLKCIARGHPAPIISWRKGKVQIDGSAGRHKLLLDGSLQVIGLYRQDSGVYTCTADNGVGSPVQKDFQLSVTVPVEARIKIDSTMYPIGSDISIPCDVAGHPTPRVQWLKDGKPVTTSEKIHITESHRILIMQADKTDAGTYTCEASNAYGNSSSSVAILVEGVFIHPNCTDNPFFADCKLIVTAKYCTHKYYARFCCKSCTRAGQLPSHGPHLEVTGTHSNHHVSRRK